MSPTLDPLSESRSLFFLSHLEIVLMPVFSSEDNHCALPSFQPSSCYVSKVSASEHFLNSLRMFYLLVCVCHHEMVIVVLKVSDTDSHRGR